MVSIPTFSPNPYANFDPSQYTNPYSLYQNQALPWPSSYSGWPTDASGRPIQPLPGMTLNSQPAAAQPAAAAPTGAPDLSGLQQQLQMVRNDPAAFGNGAQDIELQRQINAARAAAPAQAAAPAPQPQAAPSGGGGPLTVGSPLTAQQYLQLRANPGQITTPGATVAPSATASQPGPGVLQAFLAGWKPAQAGAGSGFQQGFAKALKGMGYG